MTDPARPLSVEPAAAEPVAPAPPRGRVTQWLERGGVVQFNVYAGAAAFITYFCMYGFRKPFSAAIYEGQSFAFFGLEMKTAFVISQILGYTASKYLGIKFCSEAPRGRWFAGLVGLVVASEICLLGFGLFPHSAGAIALFLNGLCLGMVWGFVVRYLEGRKVSDILLATLCTSFVVASGVTKDVGRWLMSAHGVSETWMPFAAGLVFLAPFLVAAWMLDQIPAPNAADVQARTERRPMDAQSRVSFIRQFLAGLVPLILAYLFLTAYRDYRDNYGVDILAEIGKADQVAVFSRMEIPVGILVLVAMMFLYRIQDNRRALATIFGVMTLGVAVIGIGTLAFDAGRIGGIQWMFLTGLGTYLTYVPYNAVLFERLLAATRSTGTAVFAIYVADGLGYTGSVGVQIYKDLLASESTRTDFFRAFTYALSVGGVIMMILSARYFMKRARHEETQ